VFFLVVSIIEYINKHLKENIMMKKLFRLSVVAMAIMALMTLSQPVTPNNDEDVPPFLGQGTVVEVNL
jgi:hypothetical protein